MVTATHMSPGLGGRPVDASHLEELGRTAARLSKTAGITLNDSVVQTIGHEKLNSEQVRRVVEYANVAAFNEKFASLSGQLRAVALDGGPADPVHVIQSLNNQARPQEVKLSADEYSMSPVFPKTASSTGVGGPRTLKGSLMQVLALQSKLSAAHDEIVQDLEASEYVLNEAMVDLVDRAKRASLQGATPDEIYVAWQRVHPELAKVAFRRTGMKLAGTKLAHLRTINPQQPVVAVFSAFVKTAQSLERQTAARQSIETELAKVGSWLEQNGNIA